MMAHHQMLFKCNNVSQKLNHIITHISTSSFFQKLYFILQVHQHLFIESSLNRYFVISTFLLLQKCFNIDLLNIFWDVIWVHLNFLQVKFLHPHAFKILKYVTILLYKEIGSIYASINSIQNYLFVHILTSMVFH